MSLLDAPLGVHPAFLGRKNDAGQFVVKAGIEHEIVSRRHLGALAGVFRHAGSRFEAPKQGVRFPGSLEVLGINAHQHHRRSQVLRLPLEQKNQPRFGFGTMAFPAALSPAAAAQFCVRSWFKNAVDSKHCELCSHCG